jgi:hypothetical protein
MRSARGMCILLDLVANYIVFRVDSGLKNWFGAAFKKGNALNLLGLSQKNCH